MFTLAKKGVSFLLCDKRLRREARALMGSVTKRLVCRVATSAEEVSFSFFEVHLDRGLGGNFWIWHDVNITSSSGFRLTGEI